MGEKKQDGFSVDGIVEAAARRALREKNGAGPPVGAPGPTISINAPAPGTAQGVINVSGLRGPDATVVRLIWATQVGMTVIDLPLDTPDVPRLAEAIAEAIAEAARRLRSGLVVP